MLLNQNKAYSLVMKKKSRILMHIKNQAYSCLWDKIKHTSCLWMKIMQIKQIKHNSCLWATIGIFFLLTLFTFPAAKAFASGKIKICEMRVERLEDEWITTSCPMFAIEWPGFHKFSRGPSLMTCFTVNPRQWLDSHFSPRLYITTLSQCKLFQP